MAYLLGLDFGTTFTAAAVSQAGVVRVATLGNRAGAVPATVFVRTDGSFLHGEDAFLRGAAEPLRLVRNLKRRLGDSTPIVIDGVSLDPVDLVADHLRWAVDRVVEREGGPPERLVLTHPASWRASRLSGFREAVAKAGLAPELITEPHAAAMFHAETHPLAVGDLVAAYDLGGGTFDAAVLRRTRHGFELAGEPEGEDHLGGIDFDEVVLHLVQSAVGDRWPRGGHEAAVAGVRRECVTAKEALSVETEVEVPVMLPGVMAPVSVSRRDFEHLIRPAVEESIGSFQRAIAGAGATMEDLSAVLLVGGSCRLPIVRSSIEAAVGSGVALLDADPKHAVARGAALVAEEVGPVATPSGSALPAAPVAAPMPAPETEPLAVERPPIEVVSRSRDGGRRRGVLVAAILVVVALAGAGLALLAWRDGGDAGGDGGVAGPGDGDGTEVAAKASGGSDGPVASARDMVEIPAGSYTLGAETAGTESITEFTTSVDSFHIDLYEVSNDDYVRFVQQVGAPPIGWERGQVPAGQGDHPVVGVEYAWSDSYCGALGKRLPSDAEWEVAARGPDGSLYPAGDTPEGLDLETAGSRPVGSTPANTSGFGVFDTVGSVWEWVAEPYAPVDDGQRVRRGGQYGRVRGGAAMRQVVDPDVQSTISETGFRCVADQVDAAATPGVFNTEFARPEVATPQQGPAPVGDTAQDAALVDERFEDTGSGFTDLESDTWRVGYHSPTWYHVEAKKASSQVMSLGGYNLADGDLELAVFIDKTETEDGTFRYGLVFRSEGALEQPPDGVTGPPRPEVYYAFAINPRAGVWELIHEDSLPQRPVLSGPLPTVSVTDPNAPDVLGVSMSGSALELSVNGEVVATYDTEGFHVGAGNIGLYVETFDEPFVHADFDQLTVSE